MKLPIGAGQNLRRMFQVSLLLAVAGAGLSGCYGNYAGLFPAGWNLADSRVAPVRPESSAAFAPNDGSPEPSADTGVPAPLDLAPLLENLPAASAAPALIGGLQRQGDCSLTYFDFSYAPNSTSVSVSLNSQTPRYEKTLHDNAQLNTTPDLFPVGCAEASRGTTSRPFLFLGLDKNGRELAAVPGGSGVVTSGLKSDGTFTTPAVQATQITSNSLLSGDLNGDGNADLVSINSDGLQSSVTVFLGKDDGTYEPGVNYGLPGANAQYGVLDDLNGDGILDLLVSSDSPAFAFSIFIGNGDGTFQPPQSFAPAIADPHYNDAFLTADVNGDRIRDIVTARGLVFLGKGDGVTYEALPQAAFSPIASATNNFAPSIVAADFNGDGKVDLATNDGATIRTFQGNGDGTFATGSTYPAIPNCGLLSATDLDGDGNIDLWTGYGGNGVYGGDACLPNLGYALMGKGDGTFQGVLVGDSGNAASAASLTKKRTSDAAQDLVLSSPSPGKLSVTAGQTSAPFTVIVSSPSGTAETVTLACSGLPVLATCMFQPGTVNLTPNQSSVSVSVTIGTTANTVVIPARRLRPLTERKELQEFLAIGLLGVFVVLFRTRRRRAAWAVAVCLLLVAITPLVGCSGGSSNSATFNGTPPGTYAITVTGVAGSASASTPSTLTLTVTSP